MKKLNRIMGALAAQVLLASAAIAAPMGTAAVAWTLTWQLTDLKLGDQIYPSINIRDAATVDIVDEWGAAAPQTPATSAGVNLWRNNSAGFGEQLTAGAGALKVSSGHSDGQGAANASVAKQSAWLQGGATATSTLMPDALQTLALGDSWAYLVVTVNPYTRVAFNLSPRAVGSFDGMYDPRQPQAHVYMLASLATGSKRADGYYQLGPAAQQETQLDGMTWQPSRDSDAVSGSLGLGTLSRVLTNYTATPVEYIVMVRSEAVVAVGNWKAPGSAARTTGNASSAQAQASTLRSQRISVAK